MESRTQIAPSLMSKPVSLVRWGPVIAGLFATLATGWLICMIGTALGIRIADAADANDSTEFKRLGLGVVAWMFFSWALAFFIGGATAGRFLASDDLLGKVHGFTLWSLGTVLWIVVAAVGATGLAAVGGLGLTVAAKGATSLTSAGLGAAKATAGKPGQAGPEDALLAPLSRQIESELQLAARDGQNSVAALDGDTLAAATVEIIAGRPETAQHLLSGRGALSAEQAQTVIASVQHKVQPKIDEMKGKAQLAAKRAVDVAQAAFWVMSAGALLGLAACMLGGALGARCAARSTWMREPTVAPTPTAVDVAIAH
jgi:hypothetical protein